MRIGFAFFSRIVLLLAMLLLLSPAGHARDAVHEDAPPASDTPPSVLSKRDLDGDMAKVLQQIDALETLVRNERAFEIEDVKVSHWSVGMQAAHSTQVLVTIAREIGRLLDDPRDSDKAPVPMGKIVLERGILPRGVAQSPPIMVPMSKDRGLWLGRLEKLRADWRELAGRIEEIRSCEGRYKHFILGYFDSAEWVRFATIHTAHHLKIVRDILLATGADREYPEDLAPEGA